FNNDMVWKLNSPEKVDSSMDAFSAESPASKGGKPLSKAHGTKKLAGAVSSTDRLRRLQKRTDASSNPPKLKSAPGGSNYRPVRGNFIVWGGRRTKKRAFREGGNSPTPARS